jgi:membrane protease YdiL (CAAX protease family)
MMLQIRKPLRNEAKIRTMMIEKRAQEITRSISDRQRWLEVLGVVLTGLGKFVFMDFLNWRLLYILGACLAWLAYVWYRSRQQARILSYWGFNMKEFGRTFGLLLPFALVLVILFVILGNHWQTNQLNWGIVPIMLLYPLWGIIQQFLIVALVGKNLRDMKRRTWPLVLVILFTAIVFAIVHFPYLLLVVGTFALAIVYTTLYLRGFNLLVLGIYHGWLGGFFFYTLLARDPWQEVFGAF